MSGKLVYIFVFVFVLYCVNICCLKEADLCFHTVSWMFHDLAPSPGSLYILTDFFSYFNQWENCIKWL
jgi:hypothetical protein